MKPPRPPSPVRLLADFGACLRFFSRLPVPPLSAADDPAAPPPLGRTVALLPLAGAVIALPAGVVAALADAARLPPLVTGALTVAVLAAVTGALHEDGLADAADGLYGGHTAGRRLEIMRDSRIGSYGALSLALTVLIRAAAIGAAGAGGPAALAGAVMAAAAASRAAMVGVWWAMPAARSDGLSAAAGRPSAAATVAATLLGLGATALAGPAVGADGVVIGAVAAAAAAAGVGRIALAKIGGQTGDVLGAAQQLAETAFLAAMLV